MAMALAKSGKKDVLENYLTGVNKYIEFIYFDESSRQAILDRAGLVFAHFFFRGHLAVVLPMRVVANGDM